MTAVRVVPDEVTVRRRIPVTTLARTLFDIAAGGDVESFEAAIREAEYLHRFRIVRGRTCHERQANAPG
jgi:hypothetical protein